MATGDRGFGLFRGEGRAYGWLMSLLRIYSDTPFDEPALTLLRDGVAAHELVFPAKMAESVLGQSLAGPEFAQVEVAFGQPQVEAVLASDKLRWLHVSTAGYTRYDSAEFREAMRSRGIPVTNSSSVYADACVDQFMSFLMAQSRQLLPNLASRCRPGSEEWFQLRESAVPLRGQSLVILGYGTIARRLIEVLKPYDMQITAVRRSPRGDEPVSVVTPDAMAGPLSTADHVVNILPDNTDSDRFVDATRLACMKRGAVFYNIGRGRTVDQQALADALQSRHLAAAWLDVTDPEPLPDDHVLRGCDQCFIAPHTAGGHRAESMTLVRHFLANLRRFEAGQPLLDRIM